MFATIKKRYKYLERTCIETLEFAKNNELNNQLLFKAAAEADIEVRRLLVRLRAKKPRYRNLYKSSLSPLHVASVIGHFDIVELLINNGADVNVIDDDSLTPLHLASGGGYEDIVKLLSENGANVNANKFKHVTPLHFAAEGGHLSIVQILISEKARVNAKTRRFKFNDKLFIELYDIIENWTPLHFAITNKHLDVMKFLLSIEVSTRGICSIIIDALNLADDVTFLKAIQFIIDTDNDMMQLGVEDYQELFELAIINDTPEEVIRALIKKGINVNAKFELWSTALSYLVRSGGPNFKLSLDLIKLLIENGADTNCVDYSGQTILDNTLIDLIEEREPGGFQPLMHNREFAKAVLLLLLDNGCSKDTFLKSISLVQVYPVKLDSIMLIVRHYLTILPRDEKPEYLRKPDNLSHRYENIAFLSSYWDECIAEMEKMKKKSFGFDLSLYHIITEKDLNKIASCTKNKKFITYCQSKFCRDSYPIYTDLILKKLNKGKEREKLLNIFKKITIYKGDIDLNLDCQLSVLKHLTNNDLYQLLKASVINTFDQ